MLADGKFINTHNRLMELREQAINRLALGMFVLAFIGVPISLSRTWFTGWQNAYMVHLMSLIVLSGIFFLRKKLSYKLKSWLILSLTSAVALAGLLTYGVFGNGVLWVMFSLFLSVFFFNNNITAIFTGIFSTTFIFSMYQFVYAGREIPGKADVYIASLSTWGTTFFGTLIFIVLAAIIIIKERNLIRDMLAQYERQNKIIEEQKRLIEHQANHDILTGLPTLRVADDRLEIAIRLAKREKYKVGLLFFDLDGFKKINDTYGHGAGDLILKKTALRIISTIRKSDTACRIGGDEFIIILNKIENSEDIPNLCNRLIKTIGFPVTFDGHELKVGVSIGVSTFPDDARNATEMRIKADRLMYQVKKNGKNNFLIAEPSTLVS